MVLVAVPVLVFGVPALFNRLPLFGDNLHQNFPLRTLVGAQLRAGHLPLWDPFIWSGTPLLAGFNAGAAYPTTLLFALLPPFAAWAINEIVMYAALALGCYALFRSSGMRRMPAFISVGSFAFMGAASAQVVHMDMSAGFASLPWMLLSARRIMEGRGWHWAAYLGFGYALVILGGAPEAMLDELVLLLVFSALQAGFDGTRWRRLVGWGTLAGLIALGMSAVQWMPGLSFITHSQRATGSYAFFSSGSFPPWGALLGVVPYLLGGYGQLGQPGYFGPYNLPELTTYIGVLPLVGALAVASPRWKTKLPPREWTTWFGVFVAGALLALGGNTPLEHLLIQVPLYGHQRLQSRNIVDVDLALAALFGWWLDGGRLRLHLPSGWWAKFGSLAPLVVAVAATTWAVVDQGGLISTVQGTPPYPPSSTLIPDLIAVGLAGGAAYLGWTRPTTDPNRWMRRCLTLVALDFGVFSAFGQMIAAPTPAQVMGRTPVMNTIASKLPAGGRYAVYDPQLFGYSQLLDAGDPDTNIVRQLPSVQGYGSLLGAQYEAATATHTQAGIHRSALGGAVARSLDLSVLATLPEYFIQPLAQTPSNASSLAVAQVRPSKIGPYRPGNVVGASIPLPPPITPRPPLAPHAGESWYFGTTLNLSYIDLILSSPSRAQRVGIALIDSAGKRHSTTTASLARGKERIRVPIVSQGTAGITVSNRSGIPLGLSFVGLGTATTEYVTAGSLSSVIRPSHWALSSVVKGWSIFVSRAAPMPVSVTPAAGAHASVIGTSQNGTETIAVTSPIPARLSRSVAYMPGWKATITTKRGRSRPVPVRSIGLVQGVTVPAGSSVVTFRYLPSGVTEGLVATGATIVLVLVVAEVDRLRRIRSIRKAAPQPLAVEGDADETPLERRHAGRAT